ncbi:hypothetical protein EKO27_g9179 [Xylaria grammica]|uniref:DUF1330 domain-containing protein n=1 Tax=Xylaria grammica TaxID=363999 RepID=A0A439CUT4_9PEZI|nr:hypothetical protein EKO27_g9179 [Xylaria grammica]
MVLCTLHIIALKDGVTPASFLASLRQAGVKPIVQARVFRWMILPTQISAGHLLARNIRWDMLLILSDSSRISDSIRAASIAAEWTASVGTSSKLLSGYAVTNAALLNPLPSAVVPSGLDLDAAKKADSSRNLELTPELANFISSLPPHLASHPVSMLNLISFNPGKQAQYVKYGQEFGARVGARYGGRVKIVGKVTGSGAEDTKREGWDEIAFVHYPSIAHFAAMAGDKDYQEVNHKYRLGALKDTFIICVLEVTDDGEVVGGTQKENKMKL